MPRLLLMRHAKSVWPDPPIADFDRPLAGRGMRATDLMGRHMADHGLVPQRILGSTAMRVRQTIGQLLPAFAEDLDIRLSAAFYNAMEDDYLSLIREHGRTTESLMVIGHNPATHTTALRLMAETESEDRARLEAAFPTAALAVFELESADWSTLIAGCARLVSYFKPREIDQEDEA